MFNVVWCEWTEMCARGDTGLSHSNYTVLHSPKVQYRTVQASVALPRFFVLASTETGFL